MSPLIAELPIEEPPIEEPPIEEPPKDELDCPPADVRAELTELVEVVEVRGTWAQTTAEELTTIKPLSKIFLYMMHPYFEQVNCYVTTEV